METASVSHEKVLKIRLSLKGRPIRTYVFNQDCVLVGRNPEADVTLDNAGISRDHLKIQQAPGGFFVEDLNSANGTFVNDRRVQKQYLAHEDVIQVGKFSLWVSIEDDRRAHGPRRNQPTAGVVGGTTVLRTSELQEMLSLAREAEPAPPREAIPVPVRANANRSRRGRILVMGGIILSFLAGSALGACAMWCLLR